MQVEWDLVAESFLDQLSPQERAQVLQAVRSASEHWDQLGPSRIRALQSAGEPFYVLKAGHDLRVFLGKEATRLTVLDIARTRQLDSYRPGQTHALEL